ncbi:MAG: HTTM domain-containing protein [Chloroflexi bacterium]|nr:HTTM domain-containing protein [Chloroflexota bacterium]
MVLTAVPSARARGVHRFGTSDFWRPIDFLHRRGSQPVDASSIAVFRIAFGIVALVAIIRFFAYGWIDQLYVEPLHHFSYVDYEWVRAWPAPWMHLHFGALGALSVAIILGWHARVSLLLFAVGFTYIELIDKTTYLNHYYFMTLAALLLVFIPHDRAWSLDAGRGNSFGWTPAWTVWALRTQIALVYCFAGFAKLNHDWIVNAAPLRFWLPQHAHLPIVGPLLDETWVAYAFSWAGAAFDLTIVAWLLWGRSRPLAFAVLIVFHLITGQLFMIGVFPYMMIAASLVFFSPEWPRRLLARLRNRRSMRPGSLPIQPTSSMPSMLGRIGVAIAITILAVQVVVPLRHYFYPGPVQWNEEGYRFSWRVLLTEKVGHVEYLVTDADGRSWVESPVMYVSPLQAERMTTQPDLILATAHLIRDHHTRQGRRVTVNADAFVSFNGRAVQRLIDPEVDLASEPQGIGPKPWILPPPD